MAPQKLMANQIFHMRKQHLGDYISFLNSTKSQSWVCFYFVQLNDVRIWLLNINNHDTIQFDKKMFAIQFSTNHPAWIWLLMKCITHFRHFSLNATIWNQCVSSLTFIPFIKIFTWSNCFLINNGLTITMQMSQFSHRHIVHVNEVRERERDLYLLGVFIFKQPIFSDKNPVRIGVDFFFSTCKLFCLSRHKFHLSQTSIYHRKGTDFFF